MSKVIVRFLAILGALWLVAMVIMIVAVIGTKGKVAEKTILEANFEQALPEDVPDSPTAKLMNSDRATVRDVVDAIDRGANDDRVVGMVAKIGAAPLGMAKVQEIREAVQRFRAHKKFAVAYAETFGEFGPGNGAYYLATAFDQIYLQPSGDIGLTGIVMESPFVKGTLAKLGVTFHGDHRYEYKNALNFFTETKYTPPHKEAMTAIMTSWFNQMKEGICQARQIAPEKFQAIVDAGPYLGKEAVDAKLVDGIAYRDEVYNQVRSKAGARAQFLYLDKYLDRAGHPHDHGKQIALVFGVGGVTRGKSDYDPVQGSVNMGSDTVAGAIRAAAAEKDVKAILFRVDSPGGSYVASDTITASIGVLGGKMLTSGFWDKVGLTWDEVHQGSNATMFTGTKDYSPAEWARFEAWLDRVYVDFTGKVADGRKLPKAKVLEIAKGRIWSGQDAKSLGLVDELGGYDTALNLAKKAAGVGDGEEVKIVVYPRPKTFFQSLLQRQGADNSDKEAVGQTLARILQVVQPVARKLKAAGINRKDDQDDVLRMPAIESK